MSPTVTRMAARPFTVTVDIDEDRVRTYRVWANDALEAALEVERRMQTVMSIAAVLRKSSDDAPDDEWRVDGKPLEEEA